MPVLHGFQPTPPPPLTAHLRDHLLRQFRADLKRAKQELHALPRHRTFRQQARHWHLTDRIQGLEFDLATLEGDLSADPAPVGTSEGGHA